MYASVCVFISIDNIQLPPVCGLAPTPTNGREPSLFTPLLQIGDILDSSSNKRNKSETKCVKLTVSISVNMLQTQSRERGKILTRHHK